MFLGFYLTKKKKYADVLFVCCVCVLCVCVVCLCCEQASRPSWFEPDKVWTATDGVCLTTLETNKD